MTRGEAGAVELDGVREGEWTPFALTVGRRALPRLALLS